MRSRRGSAGGATDHKPLPRAPGIKWARVIKGTYVLLWAGWVVGVVANPAAAQGTARSLDLDPSIRFAGAGGASTAVFWGPDPNEWANPAVLGYQRGARYSWGKTQLVPGLAADVFFETQRVAIGFGGIGVSIPGNLEGYGSARLDYGESEGTDQNGNPTGPFRAFENVKSWGVGVSLSEMMQTAARLAGSEAPVFSRYVDLAFGVNGKHVLVSLAPGIEGETDAVDIGFLARFTPVNHLDPPNASAATTGLPLRLDASYGYSVLNHNDARISFDAFGAYPTSRIYRNGFATRMALGFPASIRNDLGSLGWLAESLSPMISLGMAVDFEHVQAGDYSAYGYDVTHLGAELVLLNVFTLREGYYDDKAGGIQDPTHGWGVGFRLGDFAGFRYDRATVPQSSGLENVKRKGYTIFVDPIALMREIYRHPSRRST